MEATIKEATGSIKETPGLAFNCPKDTSNLTLELEAKVGKIKEDIQDNKDNIKSLQGTKRQVDDPTSLAVHNRLETWDNKESAQDEDKLRSLGEQIRNKEASLLLQERELQSELQRSYRR